MMAENPEPIVDVLIVGAGPTGLTAACELARHEVGLRIVDKLERATDKSKALVVHARTLELLSMMGCLENFLKNGIQLDTINVYDGKSRIVRLNLNHIDSPYQYALGIPQNETERLLTEHLHSFKKDIERGTELVSVQEKDEHLVASLTKKGQEFEIKCKYLIACDGAHSTVRHVINEPFEGGQYEELFQLADVKVDWGDQQNKGELCAFSSGNGNAAFFPMPENRWRVITILPKESITDEMLSKDPSLDEVAARVNAVVPWKLTLSDPVWLSNFKVRYRKVKNYRHGRIFLAGDSAHCHSPVGGQGMNTGMQDAFNLAWKLALAVKGRASESLLDSYQFERHAVAEQLLKSVDMMTRVNLLRAPIAREIRNRLAPILISQEPVQAKIRNFLTEIGINYRRSPVVAEHKRTPVRAAVAIHTDEEPRFGDWFEFSTGPHAGDRAPDAHMYEYTSRKSVHLAELFKSTKHNLLLITGDSPNDETYRHLGLIAADALGKYSDFLKVHLISCEENIPANLNFPGEIFADSEYSVHERYGAGSPCLYIIRPDAYVGFRSQPADYEGIEEYFGKIINL